MSSARAFGAGSFHSFTKPYHLVEGDCAGAYDEKCFATFEELMAYHEANPTPKGSARFAANLDRCDGTYNGLTEEERDVAP